jgi:ADP-heptose:LPS heptosyltransferase
MILNKHSGPSNSIKPVKQQQTTNEPKKLILRNFLSAGDVLVMEAAIESLHKLHPDKYVIGVNTSCDQIYENNPLTMKMKLDEAEIIDMNYTSGINNCDKRPIHFMQGYCDMLSEKLGIPLSCAVKAPKIYISEEEKGWMNQVHETTGFSGKFWLLGAASWKSDYTIKKWHQKGIQEVIDYFHGKIQFVQVGAIGDNHFSYDLDNVIDLRGKTDLRQLIRLAYWASGAFCLESFLNHLMAALGKPAVVLGSGMLPSYWIRYPTTTILTSEGCLPCFKEKPCWKSRVVKLGDKDGKDLQLCELPVLGQDPVARCMKMIEPEDVIKAIERYYNGGVLSY